MLTPNQALPHKGRRKGKSKENPQARTPPPHGTEGSTPIYNLPNEVLYQIAEHCDKSSLARLSKTSQFFNVLFTKPLYRNYADGFILEWAACRRKLLDVTLVFENRSTIGDCHFRRALASCCDDPSEAIFGLILKNTPNVDYDTVFRCLLTATMNGSPAIVRTIRQNQQVLESGWAKHFARVALWDAARLNQPVIVKRLLKVFPDIPVDCAMHLALERQNNNVVKILAKNAREQGKRFFVWELLKHRLQFVDQTALELQRSEEEEQLYDAAANGNIQECASLLQKASRFPKRVNKAIARCGMQLLWDIPRL
ncbi:hypothetical protein BJY04DRAFT_221810 [Aspergillus karnatakaensis]|uniref:uncharacterized protein n=1 Tax=Aspergillus karnatakaensis TaxID=1810916 RepID=UPI003CCE2978